MFPGTCQGPFAMYQLFGHQLSRHWTQARNAPDPDPHVANDPREPFVPQEQFDGAALAGWTPNHPNIATATAVTAKPLFVDRIIPRTSVCSLYPNLAVTESSCSVMKSDQMGVAAIRASPQTTIT